MQVSHVKLLRRSLVGLIVLILGSVGFNYIQTWRSRSRIVSQAAKILGTEMIRSADRIEYSEHEKGVLQFKLRADKLLETRRGASILQGIDAAIFNPDGSTRSQIRSRRGEYDREEKKAFFFDDVRIEMADGVQLSSDSMRYDLMANVGETGDRLTLDTGQVHGSAKGVRYDHGAKTLELKSELDFVLQRTAKNEDGTQTQENIHATSREGYYSESQRMMRFQGNALLDSDSGVLSGGTIEAAFSADKQHITSLICRENALYQTKDPSVARKLQGDAMTFELDPASGALERIEVLGSATFSAKSEKSEQILSSAEIRLRLDPQNGLPQGIQARSGVEFRVAGEADETLLRGDHLEASFFPGTNLLQSMRVWQGARLMTRRGTEPGQDVLEAGEIQLSFREVEGRSALGELQADRSVSWESAPKRRVDDTSGQAGLKLTASSLRMLYSEKGDFVESGRATGGVMLASLPAGEPRSLELRRLQADTVQFQFYPRHNRIKDFRGDGHVTVYQSKLGDPGSGITAEEFRTGSDHLEAAFREADGAIATISQWGSFVFRDAARTATADKADYDAESDVMTLREAPRITDSSGSTTGDLIRFDRKRQMLAVQGGVRSLMKSAGGGQGSPLAPPSDSSSPGIVIAREMQYWTEASRMRYAGDVQLLSESGQLHAQTLDIYSAGDRIEAAGEVTHTLSRGVAAVSENPGNKSVGRNSGSERLSAAAKSPVTIRSNRLSYFRDENSIHYSGNVTLQAEETRISSENLDVVFDQEGKQIERATARGMLHIQQRAREITGQSGDYFLNPGKFVVEGELAEIFDSRGAKSAARRLTFFTADDRILLDNR